jgi:hypothetical protein
MFRLDLVGLEVGRQRLLVLLVQVQAQRHVEMRSHVFRAVPERLEERCLHLRMDAEFVAGLTQIGPRLPHPLVIERINVCLLQQNFGPAKMVARNRPACLVHAFRGGGGKKFIRLLVGGWRRSGQPQCGGLGESGQEQLAGLVKTVRRNRLDLMRGGDAGVALLQATFLRQVRLDGDRRRFRQGPQFLFRAA